MTRSPANNDNNINQSASMESTADIVTYRNPRWCASVLLGKPPPSKSLIKAISTDDDTMNVINRWSLQYIRADDQNFSRNRPPPGASGKATPRRIRNGETPRARARRMYEKKLLSPEKNNLPPNPRRLQRVNESTIAETPIMTSADNIVETTNNIEEAAPPAIVRVLHYNTRKLHFSDSEDDEL
jgi:hypothetical protein